MKQSLPQALPHLENPFASPTTAGRFLLEHRWLLQEGNVEVTPGKMDKPMQTPRGSQGALLTLFHEWGG